MNLQTIVSRNNNPLNGLVVTVGEIHGGQRWNVVAGKVVMEGRGFGHGVGLSQWGAYGMAEEGATAEEIVRHYFQDVEIVRLWE